MDIETAWYEFSPYLYALAGVASVLNVHSTLSIVSGVLLLIATVTILRMRWAYRRKLDRKVERASVLNRERERAAEPDQQLEDGFELEPPVKRVPRLP